MASGGQGQGPGVKKLLQESRWTAALRQKQGRQRDGEDARETEKVEAAGDQQGGDRLKCVRNDSGGLREEGHGSQCLLDT